MERVSLSSLEACKQEWAKDDRMFKGGFPSRFWVAGLAPQPQLFMLPYGEFDCGFFFSTPFCSS